MTQTQNFVKNALGIDAPMPTNRNKQALVTMGFAAVPWVPVVAGAWLGGKCGSKGLGAIAGFAVSFFAIRHINKKMAGDPT